MPTPAYNLDETKLSYHFRNEPPHHSDSNNVILYIRQPTASIPLKSSFRKLAEEWKRETGHLSFVSSRLQHPAYLKILNMGPSAVPLILEEMEREPDHWFHALMFLTGENPVPADFTGTVSDAVDLWISWGHSKYATS